MADRGSWIGKRGTDTNQTIEIGGLAGVAGARAEAAIAGADVAGPPDVRDVTYQLGGADEDVDFAAASTTRTPTPRSRSPKLATTPRRSAETTTTAGRRSSTEAYSWSTESTQASTTTRSPWMWSIQLRRRRLHRQRRRNAWRNRHDRPGYGPGGHRRPWWRHRPGRECRHVDGQRRRHVRRQLNLRRRDLPGDTVDKLVTGPLSIGAGVALDVSVLGSAVAGDYVIAEYSTLAGTFASVTDGFSVSYATPGQIILTAPNVGGGLAGDFNGNGGRRRRRLHALARQPGLDDLQPWRQWRRDRGEPGCR